MDASMGLPALQHRLTVIGADGQQLLDGAIGKTVLEGTKDDLLPDLGIRTTRRTPFGTPQQLGMATTTAGQHGSDLAPLVQQRCQASGLKPLQLLG
jgi:hypothetical protein